MRVLCVSGSRADFGGIEATYKALEKIGVDTHLRNIGNIVLSHCYDLAVVLGDRFEVLSTVFDLFINKIPIAHLSGGDITEGSQDDCMRHAITKLSHLHFPTNEDSAKRIIQLGEEPWRVHVVGYPGVDVLHPDPLSGWAPSEFILVVWHPNTLESEVNCLHEATILANALEVARGTLKVIVIGPNKDAGGEKIAVFMKQWAEFTGNIYKNNLPRNQYLGLLQNAKCLVGNSSSGFYEAPSFGTPVVNVGDRQKGRAPSLGNFHLDSKIKADDIENCIRLAISREARLPMDDIPKAKVNIYSTGNAADKIAEVILNIKEPKKLLLKKFCDLNYT